MSAWPILMRLRRQGYPRSYLQAWIAAIAYLRAHEGWILEQPITVTHHKK